MKTGLIDKISAKNMNLKKIGLFVGLIASFFLFSLCLTLPVSASLWGTEILYDDHTDGLINTSLWTIAQTGGIIGTTGGVVAEDWATEVGKLTAWTGGTGNTDGTATATSNNLPPLQSIGALRLTAKLLPSAGDGGRTETLIVFGTTIKNLVNGNPTDESEWIFIRKSNGQFEYFDDGVSAGTITPTNNNISITSNYDGGIGDPFGQCWSSLDYEYYRINDTAMNVSLNLPINNSINYQNITFNATTSVVYYTLSNLTFYIYNATSFINKYNFSISGILNSSEMKINLSDDNYKVSAYVCDNQNNCRFTENKTIRVRNELRENSYSYNPTTVEGTNENFLINISYVSSDWNNILAYLNYNGTSYPGTKIGTGDNLVFNTSLVIPAINSTSQINSFYWNFILTNSSGDTYINSTLQNQTITKITPLYVNVSCPTGFSPSMFFDFATEQNLTYTNATINYNIQYGISNTISAIFGTISNAENFSICINNSVPFYTIGYGEIQYSADNYNSRRFYIFNGTRITNTTINNTLYLLDTSLAQPFTFNAKNVVLTPYVNHYLALLRWYPGLNEFKIVEMGKTDNSGNTIMSVRQNDVDYKIALYTQNGQLVYITSSSRFSCSVLPCNFPVVVNAATDFTTTFNIQSLLTFNSTTKIFTYIWNDPSQATTKMNLSVYKITGTDETIICQDSASSFTGVLTCNVSAYTGNIRAVVFRSSSPASPYAWLDVVINAVVTGLDNSIKLFIGFVFSVLLSMIGIFMGVVPALIFSIVGLMIGLYFDIITWWILAGVIVLAVAIYTILKRVG